MRPLIPVPVSNQYRPAQTKSLLSPLPPPPPPPLSGTYNIAALGTDDESLKRGCRITINLKESALEFADLARIKELITKYSNFVNFPISVDGEVGNQAHTHIHPHTHTHTHSPTHTRTLVHTPNHTPTRTPRW